MISVFFEFLTRGLIWIIKCIFDMILFYLRQLFRALRLLMVFAPMTTIVYNIFFFMLIVEVIVGENVVSSLIPIALDSTAVKNTILNTLNGYLSLLSDFSGTLMYFILFMIMLLLAIPLFMTFIAIGTVVYAGKIFVIPLIIDAIWLFAKCVFFGKNPLDILSSRYRILFPKIGKRMNEKSYERWLYRHRDEFENDTFSQSNARTPLDEFYLEDDEDDYEDEDDYSEYDDHDLYYEDEDEEYEDDAYPFYEKEDAFYRERLEDNHRTHYRNNHHFAGSSNDISSFDFFAGCKSMESATKKYRSLVKLYHPDNLDGDTTALQEINSQYNEIKKRLS